MKESYYKFDPARIRYDENGIPVFRIREIEAIAQELLDMHCPNILEKPGFTPVAHIIDRLHERTGLGFTMAELGYKGTAKILGKVSFHKKLLSLDFSLNDERKAAFRFTAAHEIGHWVLHRYNYRNWILGNDANIDEDLIDGDDSLCRLEQRSQQDWLEFHANVFAASLVTPRKTFILALIEAQYSMGITRNLGRVFVSDAEYSQRDFEYIVGRLSHVFDVSKQSVRVRMKTLQLLEDETRPKRPSMLAGKLFSAD